MSRFQCVFYKDCKGSQPVNDFLDRLDERRRIRLKIQLDRLNELTHQHPHLPFPHSSQIQGELRELRCHFGSELYRVLYRRSRNLLVLLHMFRKTQAKVPPKEIEIANKRWLSFKKRMDTQSRKPPRPVGRDAP